MKARFVISLLLIAFCYESDAQQLPIYSNYVLNYFQINPAVAGSKPCLDMKLGYRRQWMGVSEAPETAFGNIHGSFGKKKHNFHGLGAQVVNDDAGPLGILGLNIAYAYHMKMNRQYHLSAGVGVGFIQYRVDVGTITLPDVQFVNDPAFDDVQASQFMFPQIQFGLWLYKEDRFYGFSIQNVVENNLQGIGIESRMQRHFTFAAGKNIEMQDGFSFKPSAMLKYAAQSRVSLDATAVFDYKQMVELGVGFRSESGLTGLFKVDIFKYVTLAYAYDFALSRIRYDGRSTHEVIIGIQACAKGEGSRTRCAAYD